MTAAHSPPGNRGEDADNQQEVVRMGHIQQITSINMAAGDLSTSAAASRSVLPLLGRTNPKFSPTRHDVVFYAHFTPPDPTV